jgi:hypothetical protein
MQERQIYLSNLEMFPDCGRLVTSTMTELVEFNPNLVRVYQFLKEGQRLCVDCKYMDQYYTARAPRRFNKDFKTRRRWLQACPTTS